jgi:hypothetical protein
MKTNKVLIVALLFMAVLNACKKDNDPVLQAPTITGLEIGSGNNKTAYPGNDLHIEAEIVAEANIASVTLEINPVSGNGWKLNTTYTEGFVGLKNAEFHQHYDVPADAAVGDYKVVLTVVDQAGKTTKIESDLKVLVDPTLPSVTDLAVEYEGNDEIHLEAKVAAPNKIAKVIIEVHGGNYEEEFEFTDANMVGQTSYNLHKHVHITGAPVGHYHIHVKVVDQAGKSIEVEDHFDKN